MSFAKKFTAVLAASVLAGGLAACAPANNTPEPGEETDVKKLTLTEGKLTIAAAEPAYFPYAIDDDPTNGQGFETAVAYAVAEELGFAKEDVIWTRASWDLATTPGAKPYDFTLQQIGIKEDRKKILDFSSAYYIANQAVVTTSNSPVAGATSLAELKGARIGAATGTSSFRTAEDVIQPTTPVAGFNTNEDVVLALQNGQIDALVIDLPSAFYVSGVQLDGGVLLGQIENGENESEGWGLALEKDNPLTAHVTKAVDNLRANGTLDKLVEQWLTNQGAPVLK